MIKGAAVSQAAFHESESGLGRLPGDASPGCSTIQTLEVLVSFYADFAEYYESIFPYREVVRDFLLSQLEGPGRRVLDLGCGTGHYCGHLARAGHEVVGIDLDPQMIACAVREYPDVDFHTLDLRNVHTLPPGFDLVYCIGNVLAHLPRDGLGEFLERLAGVLAPGGCWLFQVVNWDAILVHTHYRFPDRNLAAGDRVAGGMVPDSLVFQRAYLDITAQNLRFVTRLLAADREIFRGEVTLYPVTSCEFQSLHETVGFRLEAHYADYQGVPFDSPTGAANIMVFRRR